MAWIVVVWMGGEIRQGFEEIITSYRTHGLDHVAWVVVVWIHIDWREAELFSIVVWNKR